MHYLPCRRQLRDGGGNGLNERELAVVFQVADDLDLHEEDALVLFLSRSDPQSLPDDPFFFPGGLGPYTATKRLFLYRRYAAVAALEELFAALQDDRVASSPAKREFLSMLVAEKLVGGSGVAVADLCSSFNPFTLLLVQLRPRAVGSAATASRSFPSAAMAGIRALTAEAAMSTATDAFRHAAAVADRTRLARCLFHLYDASLISLHSSGNAVLRRAVAASDASGSALAAVPAISGPAPEAVDGGDLLTLLELIRWCSGELWKSIEHGDGNPLWEVSVTLVSALAAALSPRGDRFDPSVEADCVRGSFHRQLVRASQLVAYMPPAPDAAAGAGVSLSARLWGSAGLLANAGASAPAAWQHGGLHAAVLLILGLWHFSVFRAEPAEVAGELRERDTGDAAAMHEREDGGGSDGVTAAIASIVRQWPGCSTAVSGSEDSLAQLKVRGPFFLSSPAHPASAVTVSFLASPARSTTCSRQSSKVFSSVVSLCSLESSQVLASVPAPSGRALCPSFTMSSRSFSAWTSA